MLDDKNVLKQRDPDGQLSRIADFYQDVSWPAHIVSPDNDDRELRNVVVVATGEAALAADILRSVTKDWFGLSLEVVSDYKIPGYAWQNTLVIASCYSGDSPEVINNYQEAHHRGCQMAVVTSGGRLLELAEADDVTRVVLPADGSAQLQVFKQLRALLRILENYRLIDDDLYSKIEQTESWLEQEVVVWHPDVPMHENYAKQLALIAVGKTPILYSGPKAAPVADRWKQAINKVAKNTAWTNWYPDFYHHELIGWSSHPVDKPFAVFDVISLRDDERVEAAMDLSDRLLSGLRPKSVQVLLRGQTLVEELLWGVILADYVSTYLAILNHVNPASSQLTDRFKAALESLDDKQ